MLGVTLAGGPLAFLFSTFTPVKQGSESMLPAVPVGTVLVMRKDPGPLRHGDVISYDPSDWGSTAPSSAVSWRWAGTTSPGRRATGP